MPRSFIDLGDCFIAYRKAKAEAFYENTQFHSLAFAEYEKNLSANLRRLLSLLNSGELLWTRDAQRLGGHAYAPKGLEEPNDNRGGGIYYRFLDPIEDWKRAVGPRRGSRVKAVFRLVIRPTIEFQIISALWIVKVGHKFDSVLNPKLSYGHRLRRQPREADGLSPVGSSGLNLDCVGLFAPYFSAYRKWRENGLASMRTALRDGERIAAITMDLQRFYHNVCPHFLLRTEYLAAVHVELTAEERSFTHDLLTAIDTWYRTTPDYTTRPQGALPVGLSASKIISNALLAEFDERFHKSFEPNLLRPLR